MEGRDSLMERDREITGKAGIDVVRSFVRINSTVRTYSYML